MTEIALRLEDVHLTYGAGTRFSVLKGFSMTIRKGELACLLGASGCGKTTVLRAIAGFERLEQGVIYVARQCVAGQGIHVSPEKRQVGMVFQEYALFPHLNAAQNVAFGLRRMANQQQKKRVAELLELVELSGYASRYPHELSGGQQQRIALARALAPQPEILLLDEPFSSLDQASRERLGSQVRNILHAAGQTALLVTHNQQEAQMMANHIGYVQDGKYYLQAV